VRRPLYLSGEDVAPGMSMDAALRSLGVVMPADLRGATIRDVVFEEGSAMDPFKEFEPTIKELEMPEWAGEASELEDRFEFRTLLDRNLRRARFSDLPFLGSGWRAAAWKCVTEGLDYIFALNICVASIILGRDWLLFVYEHLTADIDEWDKWTKQVGGRVKLSTVDPRWRARLSEMNNLTGFRTPPFGDYDPLEAARELAESGEPHDWPIDYRILVRLACPLKPSRIDETFSEWVRAGRWLTSGASSLGRVRWEFEGEEYVVKARKNQLPFVENVEKLIELCLSTDKQFARVALKAESSKLRITVVGDLPSYLLQAYVIANLRGQYLLWPGMVLGQTGDEVEARMLRTLRELAAEKFSLPTDFDGFDHQPTTEELLIHVGWYLDNVSQVGPEWEKVRLGVLRGFSNSYLVYLDAVMSVLGGLLSGIRMTSILGNGWNAAATRAARMRADKIRRSVDELGVSIQGDDSLLLSRDGLYLILVCAGYIACGARLGVGKFGLLWRQGEFLRVWYDGKSDKVVGYAPRSLVGITQRKPWSSEPMSLLVSIAASVTSLSTTMRRVQLHSDEIDDKCVTWASRLCVMSGLPGWLPWVPRASGGLGLRVSGHCGWSQPRPPGRGVVTSDWAAQLVRDVFPELTGDEVKSLVQIRLNRTFAGDDVGAVGKANRDNVRESFVGVVYREVGVAHYGPGGEFGSMGEMSGQYARALEMSQVRRGALDEWFRTTGKLRWRVERLMRHGLGRNAAIDWMLGLFPVDLPPSVPDWLGPKLRSSVTSIDPASLRRTTTPVLRVTLSSSAAKEWQVLRLDPNVVSLSAN
jgi:hypothetical protein